MSDIQQNLFSSEEMRQAEDSNLVQQQGPVTCLGMEFENDEARRAYFREELRKKLPELRKIEGFPLERMMTSSTSLTLHTIRLALIPGSMTLLLSGRKKRYNWRHVESAKQILR